MKVGEVNVEPIEKVTTAKPLIPSFENIEMGREKFDVSLNIMKLSELQIKQSNTTKESLTIFPIICAEIHVSCSDAFTVRCGTIMDLTAFWIMAENAFCGDFPSTVN